jgi:branched-chain amino acid transport system substrate-binding protein
MHCLKLFPLLIFFFAPILMAEEYSFRLGVSVPLSGALADYGTSVQNGIALAQESFGECGKKIKVVYQDSQYESKRAVSNFHAFRQAKPVQLIYFWGNPPSEAIAPLAQRYRQPVIALSSDPNLARGNTFFIRSLPTGEENGVALVKYLKKQKLTKLGVVLTENSYVEGVYKGIESELGAGGSIEIIDRFSFDEQNFRTTVSKIKTKKFDAIGVFLLSGQLQNFYRQMEAQGLKLPSFGTEFLASSDEIKASGPAIEGALYPTCSVSSDFAQRYKKKHDTESRLSIAANAYDIMALTIREFCNITETPSPEQVMERLKAAQPVLAAQQKYIFDNSPAYGERFIAPIEIRVVRGGRTYAAEE